MKCNFKNYVSFFWNKLNFRTLKKSSSPKIYENKPKIFSWKWKFMQILFFKSKLWNSCTGSFDENNFFGEYKVITFSFVVKVHFEGKNKIIWLIYKMLRKQMAQNSNVNVWAFVVRFFSSNIDLGEIQPDCFIDNFLVCIQPCYYFLFLFWGTLSLWPWNIDKIQKNVVPSSYFTVNKKKRIFIKFYTWICWEKKSAPFFYLE